jgi:alcohol-forming fatty acyl-CoA reductase
MTLGIREFYAGKAILITGVTGYLAKIIMEKIIRSCPDFKVIYVLMRLKKGVTLVDRLKKDVLNSPVF